MPRRRKLREFMNFSAPSVSSPVFPVTKIYPDGALSYTLEGSMASGFNRTSPGFLRWFTESLGIEEDDRSTSCAQVRTGYS